LTIFVKDICFSLHVYHFCHTLYLADVGRDSALHPTGSEIRIG